MNTHSPFKKAAAAITLVTLPFLGMGADLPEKSTATAHSEPAAAPIQTTRINLDIVNGGFEWKPGTHAEATLSMLAGYFREKWPEVNFVLSPGAGETKIDNLRLRSASLDDLPQALEVATDGRVQMRALGKDGRGYALRVPPRSSSNQRDVEVFNLGPYLDSLRGGEGGATVSSDEEKLRERERRIAVAVEKVKLIIFDTQRLAVQETSKEEPLQTKFHQGANLLVVVGTPRQLVVAQKVVRALNQGNSMELDSHK